MAAFVKFESFTEALAEKHHNLGADQLVVALSNAANAPSASADALLADFTQIAYTNLSSRTVTTSSSAQTTGTYKLVLADLVLTASGTVAAFRYVVLYNDTATTPGADPLIGYYDYGSDLTLLNGETLTIDFDGTGGAITLA